MASPAPQSPNLLGQIFLLKLIGHEKADSLISTLMAGDNLALFEEQAGRGTRPIFGKEDLFTPLPDGKYLFENTQFWTAFDRVADSLRRNGQRLDLNDFVRKNGKFGETMLTNARTFNALDKVFSPNVWDGRYDEATELWYNLSSGTRSNLNITEIRRAIATAHGEKLREDELKACGVTFSDIAYAVKDGDLEKMDARLMASGLHIRKSDLFAPLSDGDTVFYYYDTWKRFDSIVETLKKHGETFAPEDFLFKRLTHSSLLQRAIDSDHADKLFLPQIWSGRVQEMDRMWRDIVPAPAKVKFDYPSLREKVLEYQYNKNFKVTPQLRLDDLLKPCDDKPDSLTPLALQAAWQDMGAIRKQLATQNEHITTDLLRTNVPNGRMTYMQFAIKNGSLDQVLEIAGHCHQPVTLADLTTPDKTGRSALDTIISQKKFDQIFKAELWVGRAQDMAVLWQKAPADETIRAALQGELSRVSVLSMRERMKNKKPTPHKPHP